MDVSILELIIRTACVERGQKPCAGCAKRARLIEVVCGQSSADTTASVETTEDRSNSGIDWEPRLEPTRTTGYEPG